MSEAAITLEGEPDGPLLAPDEPGPYEVINPEGAAPVLLLCDHATNFVPRALKSLGLDEAQRARHIAWDIGVADITRDLARRLDAPAVPTRFSRLIADPNRHLDDPTLVPQIGDGAIIPGNRALTPEQRERRIETFYHPYHEAIDRKLSEMIHRGPGPAVVSMHSFTPVMKGSERPWQIGILWNQDPRLPHPVMDTLRARGVVVGDNEPYSGRGGHGYSMQSHADSKDLPNVLIELRQDLIDTHHGAAEWAALIGDVLSEVLSDPLVFKEVPQP